MTHARDAASVKSVIAVISSTISRRVEGSKWFINPFIASLRVDCDLSALLSANSSALARSFNLLSGSINNVSTYCLKDNLVFDS